MLNKRIRNDILLICVILCVASGVFVLFKNTLKNGKTAVVKVNNEVVFSSSLSKNCSKKITTEEGYNIIEIKNGVVRVKEADCRDKICVNHRPIGKTGETVVCLPHKLVVEIEGEEVK